MAIPNGRSWVGTPSSAGGGPKSVPFDKRGDDSLYPEITNNRRGIVQERVYEPTPVPYRVEATPSAYKGGGGGGGGGGSSDVLRPKVVHARLALTKVLFFCLHT